MSLLHSQNCYWFHASLLRQSRFVFDKEKPAGVESGKKPKKSSETQKDLNNAADPENLKLSEKFKSECAHRLKNGSFQLMYKSGSVDYSYTFSLVEDGKVKISRMNESEKKEKVAGGFAEPKPTVVNVTFQRLYANKVFGMNELDKVLIEAAKKEAVAPPQPEKKEESSGAAQPKEDASPHPEDHKDHAHKMQLELGVNLPLSTDINEAGKRVKEDSYGGEMTFRYFLTESKKPYVAFVIPIQGELKLGESFASTAPQYVDTTTYSFRTGVGLEVGYKVFKPFSVSVGAGLMGQVDYTDYTKVTTGPLVQVDNGTKLDFKPGAFVVAGGHLYVAPQWHLYVDVHASKTFSGGHGFHVQPVGGVGYSF